MKIFVDARTSWNSGIGRYASNTIPIVAAIMPDAHFDVLVNAKDASQAEAICHDLSNIRVTPSEIAPFSIKEQISLSSLAEGYDLTWFTNYWVPLNWRGRYFAVVHDLLHLEPGLFPTSRLRRLAARASFKKLQRSAAGLSFISRFTMREFERQFGSVQAWRVQHNGIDHAGWQPFDPEVPPEKRHKILAVGAPKAHKNFDTVVKAWNLANLPEQWSLDIVTPKLDLLSSVDIDKLTGQCQGLELHQGVSNETLRQLYGEAAIILMPSLYEGFGLPLLEGMQAGAICISSAADAMVEISNGASVDFVNGRDVEGWTLAIENACRKFEAQSHGLRETLRQNMLHASSYKWRNVAETTVSLINEITH